MDKEFKSFWQLANPLIESLKSKGFAFPDREFFSEYTAYESGSWRNPKQVLQYSILPKMKAFEGLSYSGIRFVNPSKRTVQINDIIGFGDDCYYTWAELIAIAGDPELKCFRSWLDVLHILYEINNLLKYQAKQCSLIIISDKEFKKRDAILNYDSNYYYTNGSISGSNVSYTWGYTSEYNFTSMHTQGDYDNQRDFLYSIYDDALDGSGNVDSLSGIGSFGSTATLSLESYSDSYDNVSYIYLSSYPGSSLPSLPSGVSAWIDWTKTYGYQKLNLKHIFVDSATWTALASADRTSANAILNALDLNSYPDVAYSCAEYQFERIRELATNSSGYLSSYTTNLDTVSTNTIETPVLNGNVLEYTLSTSVVYDSILDKGDYWGRGQKLYKYVTQREISNSVGSSGLFAHVTEFDEI